MTRAIYRGTALTDTTDDVTQRGAVVPVYRDDHETANRSAYLPTGVAEKYVHRLLSGVLDIEVADWCRANGKNLLLYGPTGSAKTMFAEAYAEANQMYTALVSGNYAMEPRQILGGLVGDGNGGWVWQDGVAVEVIRNGGLLLLDELNFIPSKIATVLFPLLAGQRHVTLLDNRGETIKAHHDLLVIATMNPNYAGTLDLNAALRNRFTIQRRWGYDTAVESTLIRSAHLREVAGLLRSKEGSEELYTPTPTNSLMDFERLAVDLGMDFAFDNFLSRYGDDEQGKVQMVMDAHRFDIEEEITGVVRDPADDIPEQEATDIDAVRALADLGLKF